MMTQAFSSPGGAVPIGYRSGDGPSYSSPTAIKPHLPSAAISARTGVSVARRGLRCHHKTANGRLSS
jgi:hypothetical protein